MVAAEQNIAVGRSGSALRFLGSANNGSDSGSGTVTSTDGSTAPSTLALTDRTPSTALPAARPPGDAVPEGRPTAAPPARPPHPNAVRSVR